MLPVILRGNLAGKMRDEIEKILGALAQGRQEHGENIDAVEEIAAKFAFPDEFFQIAMRGNDHADVYLDRFLAADALDFAFFEDTQELGLHRDGHVANFVEKQGAAFGLFEFADVAAGGASEGTFLVAEEFRFDQFGGDCRAIQGDKRVFMARRIFRGWPARRVLFPCRFRPECTRGFRWQRHDRSGLVVFSWLARSR